MAAGAAFLVELHHVPVAPHPQLLHQFVAHRRGILMVVAHFLLVAAAHARHNFQEHTFLLQDFRHVLHKLLRLMLHHGMAVLVERIVEHATQLLVDLAALVPQHPLNKFGQPAKVRRREAHIQESHALALPDHRLYLAPDRFRHVPVPGITCRLRPTAGTRGVGSAGALTPHHARAFVLFIDGLGIPIRLGAHGAARHAFRHTRHAFRVIVPVQQRARTRIWYYHVRAGGTEST